MERYGDLSKVFSIMGEKVKLDARMSNTSISTLKNGEIIAEYTGGRRVRVVKGEDDKYVELDTKE